MKFYEALNQVDLGSRMRTIGWGEDYIQKQLDMIYKFSFVTIDGIKYDQKTFYQPTYLEMTDTTWTVA